jgi:thioredoxin 1
MKTWIFSGAFLAAIVLSCSSPEQQKKNVSKHFVKSADSLEHFLKGNTPVLVDFQASWCAPCRLMRPIVEEISITHHQQLIVVSLDTDKFPVWAELYNIQSLPTFLLFKNQEIVWTQEGSLPKEMLEEGLRFAK